MSLDALPRFTDLPLCGPPYPSLGSRQRAVVGSEASRHLRI